MKRSGPPTRKTPLKAASGPLKRSGGLKRGDGLKRGEGLKRGAGPKPRGKPLRAKAKKSIDRQASEAWAKGIRDKPCAKCGKSRKKHGVKVEGHHALRKQALKRIASTIAKAEGLTVPERDALVQSLLWDERNRVPICDPCHDGHHDKGGRRRIPLAVILRAAPKVLQMVRELGREAEAELRREYST